MNRRVRQYIAIFVAIALYYIIHEGAHLAVALALGKFKQINLIGLGVQIDVYAEQMSDLKMGIFCLAGPLTTLIAGWLMVAFVQQICAVKSAILRTAAWYTSLTMLILDPLYLGLFYRWVGGGDMNGIALLLPTTIVSIIAVLIGVINILLVWKLLYPTFLKSFATENNRYGKTEN